MATVPGNEDVACYFTTKHSWRGKYKRIFSIGSKGITTYNPANLEVTNQWAYNDFCRIAPSVKASNELIITMKKTGASKKIQSMTFSTEHRADLLTEALRFRKEFSDFRAGSEMRFNAFKYHWSDTRLPVVLEVTPCSLDQIDPTTSEKLCSYDYKEIEGVVQVSDYPGGIAVVYGGFSRLHLFALEQRDELIKKMTEYAMAHVGVTIRQRNKPITHDQFLKHKFGKFSEDEHITSLAEFKVQKLSPRQPGPVVRTLCLSETCIIERDPATYIIVSCFPLSDIFAIIRFTDNPQMFAVEFIKGATKKFMSTDRDSLLASLLDGVRASGNRDVCVKMKPTKRGFRLAPVISTVDEEVESQHLRFLAVPPATFAEAVERFNCNIPYNGLLHAVTQDGLFAENKEKLITGAITALLAMEGDQTTITPEDLEGQFQAIRRLVASKAGFQAFTTLPKFRDKLGVKVVKALKRNDDGVTHAAIDMLCALMQPMHDNYDLRQEQMNKSSLLSSRKFLGTLLEIFTTHVNRSTGALVVSSLLDFLTFALCPPYSETTDGTQFDTLLEMVADLGRNIFKLFQHPSMAIVKGAGMVMKAVIEEGESEVAAKMQELALAEGALPRHLHTAMYTQSADHRLLTNRQLSRHLVILWVTGNPTAMALLKRIMPAGLMNYLSSEEKVPESEVDKLHVRDNVKLAEDSSKPKKHQYLVQLDVVLTHWRTKMGLKSKEINQKPVVLRKRRQRIKSDANWELFYYKFNQDHSQPNLIWNYKTREELREALEAEMRAFAVDKDLGANHVISWNHQEFEVRYECLNEEIKIGDYYLRLLLDEEEEKTLIHNSLEFFNDLYHRFLLTTKPVMKAMCLQAMTKVYSRCYDDIGAFNDTRYIVGMLEKTADRLERDRLVLFLNALIKNKKNVKEMMDVNGIRVLVDLLTLAHLHTTRAVVPFQSNLLEASPEMMQRDTEKEWYYGNKEKERLGPFSFKEMKEMAAEGTLRPETKCWAQGMDGWRALQTIPQLKWYLLATGIAVMNETDLAVLILNMLIKICEFYPNRDSDGAIVRPLPRAKRMLSEATCLPHLVQLLLTFDPIIVEKVAVLLLDMMVDNPILPRLYLTGVFFFIMMYTGSNVLPIGRFLQEVHVKQAFRAEESQQSDLFQRSILGPILPEAMVCYLENHGYEKFAQIFLGEFDTPEAIWNSEMRRMMIEKIASHLGDFTPRLQSNTRALYQYCPIPAISYPQLENELFCNIFYLRHLCDTDKFPDWPIREPVKLLKDILEAWKKEVEKKPSNLTLDEAYDILKVKKDASGVADEAKVRKAYFRMAQKYHPDKNPDGRDMFEKVNKAYEFLCSKDSRKVQGPDPHNIVLILKAQSILFKRYKEELQPYKYAGYPMLIKTIRMETEDGSVFSKDAPLLAAASELAFHTINCSALNAEELRRESGMEALQEAYSRCLAEVSAFTEPGGVPVQVLVHITRCYTVAAQFEECREKITEMPDIIKDLCRVLYHKNLPALCSVAAECVSAFCVDFWLQTQLLQAGVLWHLLLFLFNYDYTLDEGGVEKSAETNQQEIANNLARLSVDALARLGGYLTDENATPENPAIRKSLSSLLTPYIAKQLSNDSPKEILKLLNSNTENPYLIWDNATRAELNEFLETEQLRKIKTGECDSSFGARFTYSIFSEEVIVGEIFVRIYNDQPLFPLEAPIKFAADLINFLGSEAQYLHSLMALTSTELDFKKNQKRLDTSTMALEALRNVIKNNPGTDAQCIGHYKLIFSLLRMTHAKELQKFALEVISSTTANKNCVSSIADADILGFLFLTLHTLPSDRLLTVETMHALCSNTKLVKETMNKGGLIYLLDLFCNGTNPTVRERSAELFSKMMSDKLIGPKVKIILSKFLPAIFMDAMRDSAEASVHMFEANQENPELIWNTEAREKVCSVVKQLKDKHYEVQKDSPDIHWKLPDDFEVMFDEAAGELIIGGIYLRLFIQQPAWVLRKPKEFLVALLQTFVDLLTKSSSNGESLETVTQATLCLFTAQPQLADQVPGLGHIPNIIKSMSSSNDGAIKSAVQVVHILSANEICVRSMAQVSDCISHVIKAMDTRPDVVGAACEGLYKIFEKNHTELVSQALQFELVQYLLGLLNGTLKVENQAATKAQIVKALKAMLRDLTHGMEINKILEASSVWASYRDQKHDLFISDKPAVAGYLTGTAGVAGYLTMGSSNPSTISNVPPPVDRENAVENHS